MSFNPQNFYLERQGTFKIKRKHKIVRLDDKEEVIIFGRQLASHLVLYNLRCNLHHADIFFVDGRIFIRDCGGSAGTYVNNVKIRRTEKELFAEDFIGFGFNPFKAHHLADSKSYIYKVKKYETITLDSDNDSDVEVIEEQVVPQTIDDSEDEEEKVAKSTETFEFPSLSQLNDQPQDTNECDEVLERLWISSRRKSFLMYQPDFCDNENSEVPQSETDVVQNPGYLGPQIIEVTQKESEISMSTAPYPESELSEKELESESSVESLDPLNETEIQNDQEKTLEAQVESQKTLEAQEESQKTLEAQEESQKTLEAQEDNQKTLEAQDDHQKTLAAHDPDNKTSKPQNSPTTAQLIKQKEAQLRHYKTPTTKFIDNLPSTSSKSTRKKVMPAIRSMETTKAVKRSRPEPQTQSEEQKIQPTPKRPILERRQSIFEQMQKVNNENMTLIEKKMALQHWKQPQTQLIDAVPMIKKRKVAAVVKEVPTVVNQRKAHEPKVPMSENEMKIERMKKVFGAQPKRRRRVKKKGLF